MAEAVKLEHVSKAFVLRHQRARSFQDLFVNLFRLSSSKELFLALDDVSFEVKRGQTLGIIGRNGSGKSTALKLMCRILEPTSGKITVNGKVSALLELGAGFHPDLTGKENIYLNGSLLGIGRKQMDRKYEEIVEFSELQHFIDTPVKHYSSGMRMRLGFAVSVAVDPDILIADEVLAVGDSEFQRKCLERMRSLRQSNKTVIVVSHDQKVVRDFCDETIWLDKGCIREHGPSGVIVGSYTIAAGGPDEPAPIGIALEPQVSTPISAALEPEVLAPTSAAPAPVVSTPDIAEPMKAVGTTAESSRWGSGEAEIVKVELCDSAGNPASVFETGKGFVIRMYYIAHQRISHPAFGIAIHTSLGMVLSGPNTRTSGVEIKAIEGPGCIEFVVADLPLLEGQYAASAAIYDQSGMYPYDHHDRLYPFSVVSRVTEERYGAVLLGSSWRVRELSSRNSQM